MCMDKWKNMSGKRKKDINWTRVSHYIVPVENKN